MKTRIRPNVSFFALVVLAVTAGALAQPAPPVRAGRAGAARRAAARETGWPKRLLLGDSTVLLDAPEAESLDGTELKARGTARIRRSDEAPSAPPAIATLWYDATVKVDRSLRTMTLESVTIARVQLPGATPARQQRLATRLGQVITRHRLSLPLDDVLADARFAAMRNDPSPRLGTEPPNILFETEPAVLVVFDGAPRFRAVDGTLLERAMNTPFLVLRDPSKNAFFLDGGTMWFRAPDAAGPYGPAVDVPREAVEIARRDLKDAGVAPDDVDKAAAREDKRVPKILVATEPTELIVSDGPPVWKPEVEGELEAMSNTENDVFRTPDGRVFLVLSGRWYRSGAGRVLAGPFSYVAPDELPAAFRRISPASEKADVLAFVPGTAEAREALKDAATPRTTAVRRSTAHVDVTYDGDPKFESVPDSSVEYALNTPQSVLRIRGRYYVCDQGVWFTGETPRGPWQVADSIPDQDIRTIPPESPVYNTRFVTVYDSTPDAVYVAYTPAYLGSYPYGGTVVFGTGFFYRPWWGAAYYPRPWTWGFHARYARWGGWGWGFGWGPAWGGFRYGFGFGWGARWCGPGGFYRPAFRNVNVTRNVMLNRTVNRSLYASGANSARAARQGAAAKPAAGTREAGVKRRDAASAKAGRVQKAPHERKAGAPGKHGKVK